MLNPENIRKAFTLKKNSERLSFEVIAPKVGVNYQVLYRFIKGEKIKLASLVKIAPFCGIDNISGGIVCDGNTLENVSEAIYNDQKLTVMQKKLLWDLFCASYQIYRRSQGN